MAGLKRDARMAAVLARLVRLHQRRLTAPAEVPFGAQVLRLDAEVSRRIIRGVRRSGLPHNRAQDVVRRAVVDHLAAAFITQTEGPVRDDLHRQAGLVNRVRLACGP